ncbi:MAG: hypothetical protein ABIH92_01505, partial [Nanoarchaeota archaeon]
TVGFDRTHRDSRRAPAGPQLGYAHPALKTKVLLNFPSPEEIRVYREAFEGEQHIEKPNIMIRTALKEGLSSTACGLDVQGDQDRMTREAMSELALYLNRYKPHSTHMFKVVPDEAGTERFETVVGP